VKYILISKIGPQRLEPEHRGGERDGGIRLQKALDDANDVYQNIVDAQKPKLPNPLSQKDW
jgi:hypothetical protein